MPIKTKAQKKTINALRTINKLKEYDITPKGVIADTFVFLNFINHVNQNPSNHSSLK